MPIWDEEIFVLISPGKLSISSFKLEQGGGSACGGGIARKDTYRGREGGTERARHVRVGGTAQGNTVRRDTHQTWEWVLQKAASVTIKAMMRSQGRQAVNRHTEPSMN